MASIWTPELKKEVAQLWKTFSAVSIAAQLQARGYNFSRSAIIGLMHRAGLTGAGLPISARDRRSRAPGSGSGARSFGLRQSRINIAEAKLQCVGIVPRHVSLVELERGECRYPYGDGPFTFCGHPAIEGSSYCAPHHHVCRIPPHSSAAERERRAA